MPQERHRKLLPNEPCYLFLNLNVSLYPAASRGLVSSSVYVIFWGICISIQAIAMSVFMFISVILSLPHYCLSLWKHFISICCVQSVFASSWRSFFNSPAPSAPSLHFRNTFSVLPYLWISYFFSLMSFRSLASKYCFRKIYSFTDP